MLKMIKMPKPKSCSVCCIAMLTSRTFDEAKGLCFENEPKDFSMNFEAMGQSLRKANLNIVHLENGQNNFSCNALIECKHKTRGYWHYIVYDVEQQTFLDPIPNPPPISEYEFYRTLGIK